VKTFSLVLRRFADEKPRHEQEIFYLHTSSFYSTIEPRFVKAEYQWFQYDEDGEMTGEQVIYDPEDPEPPEGCRLIVLLAGTTPTDTDLWCPFEDLDLLVGRAERESES